MALSKLFKAKSKTVIHVPPFEADEYSPSFGGESFEMDGLYSPAEIIHIEKIGMDFQVRPGGMFDKIIGGSIVRIIWLTPPV